MANTFEDEDISQPASITAQDMKNLTCLFTEKDMEEWLIIKDHAWDKFVTRHTTILQRVMCPFCDRITPRPSLTRHLQLTLFRRHGKGGDGYRHGSRADPDHPNCNRYRVRSWA